jgi:TRAP-type mannitol/chloroaromatic compound transport system permease small subunit
MVAPLIRAIDRMNAGIGVTVAWFALAMVLVQFLVVVLRYIFGVGSLFLQESIVYLHGTMFMLGSAYTLLNNGHVRVDVFYREASAAFKAKVDLFGHLLLLVPVCVLIAIASWPYVANSWASMEGSRETSGIQGVFLLKSVILVFCALMILQGLAQATKAALVLSGRWSSVEAYGADPEDAEDPGAAGPEPSRRS